jgi:adducin
MSDRSRVSLILNSEAFRKELEEIVDEQLRQGNAPASLLALQQISNLLLPNHKFSQGAVGTGCKASSFLMLIVLLRQV